MKKTFTKKRYLISATAVLLMVVILAMPTFASVKVGNAGIICGWNQPSPHAFLCGHGIDKTVTVGTAIPTSADDTYWYVRENVGGALIRANSTTGYCLNIYRVQKPGGYYMCTGYDYDVEYNGRDQRVSLIQADDGDNYTYIKLKYPVVTGDDWYLVADYSSPVSKSDVIWYSSNAGNKAKWL